MRVLLAGATGTVGTELTAQLLDAGHEVLGITRSRRGADGLRAAGAEAIIGDMMARDALLEALEGMRADAVIHQATAITKTPTRHRDLYATNALRSHGTANLLAAAELTGARRFVTQSFLFGYGYRDHGPVPVTEDAPFGEPGRGGFGRHLASMRSNEDQVLGSRQVEGIALRYGVFYGPEASTLGLFDQLERRRLPVPSRSGTLSLVHIEDAASSAVAALERGRGGHAYNIADDHPLTWTDYLSQVAEAAGGPPPRRVPGWLLRASPYLGTMMIGASLSLDTGKAKRELGWAPRYASCVEGLAQVARHREQECG